MKIGTNLARLAGVLCAVSLLAGCAWLDEDDTGDNGIAYQQFAYNGTDWKISDLRDQGALTIMADPVKTAGMGTLAGQVFATPDRAPMRREVEAVVRGWFASTGRTCSVTDGNALENQSLDFWDDTPPGDQAWQFHYRCDWLP